MNFSKNDRIIGVRPDTKAEIKARAGSKLRKGLKFEKSLI